MAFRRYAERVLFGDTLEDKLALPEAAEDTERGAALLGPITPSRPAGLSLAKAGGARVSFPKLAQLDNEKARGHVLHFFANHELLALELMALALLRFPDAPDSFRRRLVVTMRDEQRHMKLYLERMQELGVELGEIPLNSFFWSLLSTIERPIDFVVGMSLTFEQANLDYSCHYRDAFAALGDEKTRDIMQTVLVDEIAHVHHGVQYFNQWRAPEDTQWDAYRRELHFPLTPARAKGIGFTVEHRQAAGLEDDFIERLRVFSHSKGRPPRVFLFNPGTELALAHGKRDYTPPAPVQRLAEDLETLPQFLMAREDALLVRNEPSHEHLHQLQRLGYTLPEFIATDLDRHRITANTNLSQRPIGEFVPWGWDPKVAAFLAPLEERLTEQAPRVSPSVEARATLSSKAWLSAQIPELLRNVPAEFQADLITEALPTVAKSTEEAAVAFSRFREHGYDRIVFKAPFGTAGHAAIRGRGERLEPHEERWISQVVEKQGSVVVEPWYPRELDLSYLFEVRADGSFREVGLSRFFTDTRGGYKGALLGPLSAGLSAESRAFLFRGSSGMQWLQQTAKAIVEPLLAPLRDCGFQGRAGIDMMVVRDIGGELKLRAPLELNPRPTMGHVALGIHSPLPTRTVGLWLLVSERDCKGTSAESLSGLLRKLQEVLPAQMASGKTGMKQGAFSTNEISTETKTLSLVLVAPRLKNVLQALRTVGLEDPLAAVQRPKT